MKTEHGFTLAEVLVVMAIVAIVGLIMVVTFTNTLRGSNKSQILAVIKQNGQAVLENMDKTIRNADNVVCVGSTPNTLVIVKNGVYTRYRVTLNNDGAATAPASCIGTGGNGCIIWDNPTPEISEITPQSFINRVCNPTDLMSAAQILTDTNTQTGVKVHSGSFSLSKSAGFKTAVTVKFQLKPGADAPSVVAGQIDPVEFQTTIGLR